MEPKPQQNQSDHDLLIRLDQKVGTVVEEMRLIRDDSGRRLNAVEENKVNKSDFNEFKVQLQRETIAMQTAIAKDIQEKNIAWTEKMKVVTDGLEAQGTAIATFWKYIFIGTGIAILASVVWQSIAPNILSHLIK